MILEISKELQFPLFSISHIVSNFPDFFADCTEIEFAELINKIESIVVFVGQKGRGKSTAVNFYKDFEFYAIPTSTPLQYIL